MHQTYRAGRQRSVVHRTLPRFFTLRSSGVIGFCARWEKTCTAPFWMTGWSYLGFGINELSCNMSKGRDRGQTNKSKVRNTCAAAIISLRCSQEKAEYREVKTTRQPMYTPANYNTTLTIELKKYMIIHEKKSEPEKQSSAKNPQSWQNSDSSQRRKHHRQTPQQIRRIFTSATMCKPPSKAVS